MSLQKKVTFKEIAEHTQKELDFFKSVAPFPDAQMEGLRVNAIAVAEDMHKYATTAAEGMGADTVASEQLLTHLMQPQVVRLRNPEGQVMGVVTVRQILSATPAATPADTPVATQQKVG